jgi:hypothetical protein
VLLADRDPARLHEVVVHPSKCRSA